MQETKWNCYYYFLVDVGVRVRRDHDIMTTLPIQYFDRVQPNIFGGVGILLDNRVGSIGGLNST